MACIWTFRRIADFLKHGPGVWYQLEKDALMFNDGIDDPKEREGTKLYHYR